MITAQQLADSFTCPLSRAQKWIDAINSAMNSQAIDTVLREAHFLAQIGHESGRLVYVKELASGEAYEGRKDLGNTQVGDGVKYKGRGLIQITGRANYQLCGNQLGLDLINHPELLELPLNAAKSAAWFWNTHGLNILADQDDLIKITKRINGGTNGLVDRSAILTQAKKALS